MSARSPRERAPAPIDPGRALQQSLQQSQQTLAFERGEFAPFFDIQQQLGGAIQESLGPLGAIPQPLSEAFQRNVRAAQSARGLATSPLGAASEARQLAGLGTQIFGQTTGAAQQFLGGFRPTTGFAPTAQTLFGANLTSQQQFNQGQAAIFNAREAREFQESAQKRQAFASLAGLAGGAAFGGAGGAAIGGIAGGLGGAPGGVQAGVGGGLLGSQLPSLFASGGGAAPSGAGFGAQQFTGSTGFGGF